MTDNEEKIVKIPLISKPGEPNANGIIFDRDSFIKAMDSEFTKEAIKNRTMPLFVDFPINDYTAVIENTIGEVLFFDTESVTVKMSADTYSTYHDNPKRDYYGAGLLVEGKMREVPNIFEIKKILWFQLTIKKYGIPIRRII